VAARRGTEKPRDRAATWCERSRRRRVNGRFQTIRRKLPMHIQLNTDHHIQSDPSVARHVEQTLESSLARFSGQITRVEVHLQDTNAGKSGDNDKHCLLEARLEGRPPVVASDDAATVAMAVSGAAKKLQRALDSSLGKLG
jgi:ribosome-associated translation inhibitor RaiA